MVKVLAFSGVQMVGVLTFLGVWGWGWFRKCTTTLRCELTQTSSGEFNSPETFRSRVS